MERHMPGRYNSSAASNSLLLRRDIEYVEISITKRAERHRFIGWVWVAETAAIENKRNRPAHGFSGSWLVCDSGTVWGGRG